MDIFLLTCSCVSILTGERQSCQIWRENVIGKSAKSNNDNL